MKITKKVSWWLAVGVIVFFSFSTWRSIAPVSEVKIFLNSIGGKASEFVNSKYPEKLIIEVKSGNVTINEKTPYCLKLDEKANTGIIFDTTETPNVNSFETKPANYPCKPAVIVGKNYVMYFEEEKGIKIQKIPSNISTEINRNMLIENVNKVAPIVAAWGWKLYLLLPGVIFIFLLGTWLLVNFWYGLVLLLAAKVFKLEQHPEMKDRYWIALFFNVIFNFINFGLIEIFSWEISFPFATSIFVAAAGITYLKYRQNKDQPISSSSPTGQ